MRFRAAELLVLRSNTVASNWSRVEGVLVKEMPPTATAPQDPVTIPTVVA